MNYIRLFRYVLVGAFTALLYFGVIAYLVDVLYISKTISLSVSYVLAVIFHFLASRAFTFSDRKGSPLPQGARYLILLLANYFLSLYVTLYLCDKVGLNIYASAGSAIGFTIFIGYIVSNFWVFKRASPQ